MCHLVTQILRLYWNSCTWKMDFKSKLAELSYQFVICANGGPLLKNGTYFFSFTWEVLQTSLTTAVLAVTLLSQNRRERGASNQGTFRTVTSQTSNAQLPFENGMRRFRRWSWCCTGCCCWTVILITKKIVIVGTRITINSKGILIKRYIILL